MSKAKWTKKPEWRCPRCGGEIIHRFRYRGCRNPKCSYIVDDFSRKAPQDGQGRHTVRLSDEV